MKKARNKELFRMARNEIKVISEKHKMKSIDELRALVSERVYDKINVSGDAVEIMIWAEDHGADKIAVIVDAYRKMFFGMGRRVIAEGFYKSSDGSVLDFEERDYYSHGLMA